MTRETCERVRELIPAAVAERLSAEERRSVEDHLDGCGECRAEAELVGLLRRSAPAVPDGLSARIQAAVSSDRRRVRRPWWGVAAAAVAALAVGIGLASDARDPAQEPIPIYAAEGAAQDLWLSEDGIVAGAPSLESLSDEALRQLLDELGSGGAA